jgi:hypothetical protein
MTCLKGCRLEMTLPSSQTTSIYPKTNFSFNLGILLKKSMFQVEQNIYRYMLNWLCDALFNVRKTNLKGLSHEIDF